MVSKTAQADIEDMWEQGLKPSVSDIIRLNALGIKLERCNKPDESIFNIRRCAFLGDGENHICFMQPTVAHDIWRDTVEKIIDFDDSETSIATDAYICATPYDKLPNANDYEVIKKSINEFLKSLYPYTTNQIAAAILYCTHGTDWMQGEYAPPNPNEKHDTYDEFDSISLGIMLGGIATGIGLTLSEAKSLTRSQIMSMIHRHTYCEGNIDKKRILSTLEDDYFRTLDEITAQLKSANKDQKQNG